jgi:type I restriction enzyme S subunit
MSELPEGWAEATIGEIASVQLGKMLDRAKRTRGTPLPYLRNANVRWNSFNLSNLLEMRFEDHELERFDVRRGDLFVCEGGEPGRCAVWTGNDRPDLKFQKAILRVRPFGGIDPHWMMYALHWSALNGDLAAYFTGSTIKHFSREAVLRFKFRVPPLAEQRRIVEKVEALLAREAAISKRIHDVQRGLDIARASLLETVIGLRDGDETESIGELGDVLTHIQAGKSFACLERRPRPDEVGVVKVSAVTWGAYDEAESKTCTSANMINPDLFVRPGDFLFSRANTIELVGACVIAENVTQPVMLSDKILRFTFSDAVDTRWILHVLRSRHGRREIERLSTGNQQSMRNIGQERIRSIRIPLPPLEKQRKLVAFIEAAFERLAKAEGHARSSLSTAGRLPKSVLTKAFAGELIPSEADLARREGRDFDPASELVHTFSCEPG